MPRITLHFIGHLKNGDTVPFDLPIPYDVTDDITKIREVVHSLKARTLTELATIGMLREGADGGEEIIPANMFTKFSVKETESAIVLN